MQILQLNKFSMSEMSNQGRVIVVLGDRFASRALVLDCLRHLNLPLGLVISLGEKERALFKDHVPDIFIHNNFSQELLSKFLQRQSLLYEKYKYSSNSTFDQRSFIVLDDCIKNEDWTKSEIKTLFMNGRHLAVTLIVTLQSGTTMPPMLRNQIDYVFLCNNPNRQSRIYSMCSDMFQSEEQFNDTVEQCCQDTGCLVLKRFSHSYDFNDHVCWYKFDLDSLQDVKICHSRYWQVNNQLIKTRNERLQQVTEEGVCSICDEKKPLVAPTMCSIEHQGCRDCLTMWLDEHDTCPFCRQSCGVF